MVSKSIPQRSLKNLNAHPNSTRSGIIKLDVFSVFLANPKVLLYSSPNHTSIPSKNNLAPNIDAVPRKRGRPAQKRSPENADIQMVQLELHEIPRQISLDESYNGLTKFECDSVVNLKVTYAQYIKARNTLIITKAKNGHVKKRDVGRVCRMDVNKAGKLYDFLFECHWLD